MGSIREQIVLDLSAEKAWSALRQVGEAHKLFAGPLIDGSFDGEVRTVTFDGGLVVRERIIDVNDEYRRVVHTAFEGTPMTHHNASMQIVSAGADCCLFVWIADFLPDDFAETMLPLIRRGMAAFKSNLESGAFPT